MRKKNPPPNFNCSESRRKSASTKLDRTRKRRNVGILQRSYNSSDAHRRTVYNIHQNKRTHTHAVCRITRTHRKATRSELSGGVSEREGECDEISLSVLATSRPPFVDICGGARLVRSEIEIFKRLAAAALSRCEVFRENALSCRNAQH